jgi:cytochrome c
MKRVVVVIAMFLFAFSANSVKAQDSTSQFFKGKWEFFVKGTPNGDVTLPVRFDVIEGNLKGYFFSPDTKSEVKMDTVFLVNEKISMAFNIMSYDVTLYVSKKDPDHAVGSLMEMFEVLATRRKEEEVKTSN